MLYLARRQRLYAALILAATLEACGQAPAPPPATAIQDAKASTQNANAAVQTLVNPPATTPPPNTTQR